MDNFQLWKLAADGALILSVLLLCVRFMRSQRSSVNTRELRDLEIVLKNLVKDADVASRSLAESLSRRQQALERLLTDLEGSEQRISGSLKTADDLRQKLSREITQMQLTVEQSIQEAQVRSEGARAISQAAEEVSRPARKAQRPAYDPPPPPRYEENDPWAEPPSFDSRPSSVPHGIPSRRDHEVDGFQEDEVRPRRTGAAAYQSAAIQRPSAAGRYNIYGEPLAAAEEAPASPPRRAPVPRQPLADDIEVERIRPPRPQQQRAPVQNPALQNVYEAAERLLQAGDDLEAVSAETKLPLEEVRRLSQILIRAERAKEAMAEPSRTVEPPAAAESQPSKDPASDPRLGVFANIRRQTQVL